MSGNARLIRGVANPGESSNIETVNIPAPRAAEVEVVPLAHLRTADIRGEAGAAKMVAMQIREHAALLHGDALTAQVVILSHRRSREAHVIQRHPTIGHVVEQLHAYGRRIAW